MATLYEVLQKQLRSGELRTPELNDRNRQLFGLAPQVVVREAVPADREVSVDQAKWDALRQAQRLQWHLEG
jgi:hypothetical protein